MGFQKEIKHLFEHGQEIYLKNISIDCVIFGYEEAQLKVLLLNIKYAKEWALPGGFISKKEHIEEAARRILKERTGLESATLEQFHIFSDPNRTPKKDNQHFLKNCGLDIKESWLFDRFISVGFWTTVAIDKVSLAKDPFSESSNWFNIYDRPELVLDHNEIVDKALNNLRNYIEVHPIGLEFLPPKFTMPELQKLYETILNSKLDRRNFQRKILNNKILIKLKETKKGVAHKAPFYYSFDMEKYKKNILFNMEKMFD